MDDGLKGDDDELEDVAEDDDNVAEDELVKVAALVNVDWF